MIILKNQKGWHEQTLDELENFQRECEKTATIIDDAIKNLDSSTYYELYSEIYLSFEDFKKVTISLYDEIVRCNKPFLQARISALKTVTNNQNTQLE